MKYCFEVLFYNSIFVYVGIIDLLCSAFKNYSFE